MNFPYKDYYYFYSLSLLAKSAEIPYEEDVEIDNLYISKAIEYIQKNYQNPILVADIANYVSLSRTYLTTIFQQTMHLSPQQFLLKFRITKASELLMNTTLSINTIAHSCGYTDPLAFSKTFKKVTGLTPTQYRKSNTENYYKRDTDPHKRKDVESKSFYIFFIIPLLKRRYVIGSLHLSHRMDFYFHHMNHLM